MTRDNLSYPWNATQHDLCHLLPTVRPPASAPSDEERRGEDPFVRSFAAAIACRHAV
jgi:hypothetical protein